MSFGHPGQAGMALILAVALGYFGSLKEDPARAKTLPVATRRASLKEKLIKMGLLTKLAGFFCKKLPTLVP